MTWRPTSDADAARRRADMLSRIRGFFAANDVLSVDTPALSRAAVSDPNIESLSVDGTVAGSRSLYLNTSPEFHMKRLLAAGYPDVYSVCRVFRDAELGSLHQPEFTMVEWYRRAFGLDAIIDETLQLITAALDQPGIGAAADRLDYADAFRRHAGLDPFDAPIDALADFVDADADLRDALGDQRDDWLDLVLGTRVAPAFPPDRLTVLKHYPASQAALARLCPGDQRVADRFEVFAGPLELANGYVELRDADEQESRMRRDDERRQMAGQPLRPHDRDLLAALEHGLPHCAGVAMGLERLHMVYDQADDIRDVVTFVFEDSYD